MNVYRPHLKVELKDKDVTQALKERRELGFGRANRLNQMDPHFEKFPLLDELTFLLEDHEGGAPKTQ